MEREPPKKELLFSVGPVMTEPVREDFIDLPTGWRLQREGVQHTDDRCSAVQTNGGMLCDCGAIETEWSRRVAVQKASDDQF
jgi:hypothetical protein